MSKGNLRVKGGCVVVAPGEELLTDLWISAGKILCLGPLQSSPGLKEGDFETFDASGMYVTPGLIDLQMNGGPDCDLWQDPSPDQLKKMRIELASHGVTSFLPTLITDDIVHLRKNIDFLTAQGADRKLTDGDGMSRMLGIHLEGPCLSPKRPGVHPPQHIQPFTPQILEQIITPQISLMTAACENDTSGEAIAFLKNKGVRLSLGHSNASYEEASLAFDRGVRLMTHTFNALPPLHHRQPGAVGAALLRDDVVCCLIADGLHLSPEACALVLKVKTIDRCVLVTDRASVGTTQGGLVGSSITLDQAVANICHWGLGDFSQAVTMATTNAARAIGLGDQLGSIKSGFSADLAFFDIATLKVREAAVGGCIVGAGAKSVH